jgi:hypothetical protein
LDGCEKVLGLGDSEVLVEMSHADVVVSRREHVEHLEEDGNALWAEHQQRRYRHPHRPHDTQQSQAFRAQMLAAW